MPPLPVPGIFGFSCTIVTSGTVSTTFDDIAIAVAGGGIAFTSSAETCGCDDGGGAFTASDGGTDVSIGAAVVPVAVEPTDCGVFAAVRICRMAAGTGMGTASAQS